MSKEIFTLLAAAFCMCASAETFMLPVEQDAGFTVETDWKGHASLSEIRLSTGERGAPLQGPTEQLNIQQPEERVILDSIFINVDSASTQAECQAMALLVLCRNTRGLAIKMRSGAISNSAPFVSQTGFLWCVDGLVGRGACKDTEPTSSTVLRTPGS